MVNKNVKIKLIFLLFVFICSCKSSNLLSKNDDIDLLLKSSIQYFDKNGGYQNIELKKNNDTIYLLNYQFLNTTLPKKCNRFKTYNIYTTEKTSENFFKLYYNKECIFKDNISYAGVYQEDLNGIIYLFKKTNNKVVYIEFLKGEFKILYPYLNNFKQKKIILPEPKIERR